MNKQTERELFSDLKTIEMKLAYANCHSNFFDTRNAIKGLQRDMEELVKKYTPYVSVQDNTDV